MNPSNFEFYVGAIPKNPLCQNHLWNNPNRFHSMTTVTAVKNLPQPGKIMEDFFLSPRKPG